MEMRLLAEVVNHFRLVGHYDNPNAYYDVTITNASGQEFTATGLTYSNGAIPSGASLEKLTFNTFNSTGDYLIDNVTVAVPEPGTVLGLAAGLLCLLARRRRG